MRISDWSSDVCSSDLNVPFATKENGFAGLDTELVFNGPPQVKHIQQLGDWAKEGKFVYAGRRNEGGARFRSGECDIFTESSDGYAGVRKAADFAFGGSNLPYWDDVEDVPHTAITGGASTRWVSGAGAEVSRG